MSDRDIRSLERRAKADPSDEAAAEAARAARWRAGRPTAADRLAAILADPKVRAAHWDRVPGSETEEIEAVLAAAAPFARGAWLQDRLEIAEGLARAFCWSYVPDVASGLAWGQPERAAVAQIFFEWAARNHAAMAAARGGAAAGFRS